MTDTQRKTEDPVTFLDAYLLGTKAILMNNFDPKYANNLKKLQLQTMYFVDRSEFITGDLENTKLLRLIVRLGARWIDLYSTSPTEKDSIDEQICALIEADFALEYGLNETFDQETIDSYALGLSQKDIWPFWKEFLASQTNRMNLHDVEMPHLG